MADQKTIYLIDGSAYLYRAFHAIRSLSTSQGHPTNATFGFTRILLKLIDRETERTPYTLIKDFRGGVSAVFWQGIARLFKNDLKSEYDPEEEDRILEEIVVMIEAGYL